MLVSAIGKLSNNTYVQSTFKSMPKEEPVKEEPLPQADEEPSSKLDLIA